MASLPLAHALETAKSGPRKPYAIEICAEAAFAISIGMKNGVTFDQVPSRLAFSELCQKVKIPPIPVAMTAPLLSSRPGSERFRPESSMASFAATSANCEKRSMRLDSRFPISASGSKSLTSAAKRVEKSLGSNAVMGPTPLSPAISLRQNSSLVLPRAVTAPRPVTTTRRLARGRCVEASKTSHHYGGSKRDPLAKSTSDAFRNTPAAAGVAGRIRTAADPYVSSRGYRSAARRGWAAAYGHAAAISGTADVPAQPGHHRDQHGAIAMAPRASRVACAHSRHDIRRRVRRPIHLCRAAAAREPRRRDILYRDRRGRTRASFDVATAARDGRRSPGSCGTRRPARRSFADDACAASVSNRSFGRNAAALLARTRSVVRISIGTFQSHDPAARARSGRRDGRYDGSGVRAATGKPFRNVSRAGARRVEYPRFCSGAARRVRAAASGRTLSRCSPGEPRDNQTTFQKHAEVAGRAHGTAVRIKRRNCARR